MSKSKKKGKEKGQTIYIYHDSDHGDLEIFSSFEAAEKHADTCWDMDEPEPWEECSDTHWCKYEYVHIYKRVIDAETE